MIPVRPSKFCLKKIDSLVVDTRAGRVYRNGKEIAATKGPRKRIGMRDKNGRSVCFYRYHVVWYFATGKWPRLELDHKDENTSNDRYSNLQEITHSANCLKSKRSGLPLGIDLKGKRYRVRYSKNGASVIVGTAATVEDAVKMRKDALS